MIVWLQPCWMIILCVILSQENFANNSWWIMAPYCYMEERQVALDTYIISSPHGSNGWGLDIMARQVLYDSLSNELTCLFYWRLKYFNVKFWVDVKLKSCFFIIKILWMVKFWASYNVCALILSVRLTISFIQLLLNYVTSNVCIFKQ